MTTQQKQDRFEEPLLFYLEVAAEGGVMARHEQRCLSVAGRSVDEVRASVAARLRDTYGCERSFKLLIGSP